MTATRSSHRSAGGMPLEPIERSSTDELRALQLERLRSQLTLAWEKVPHYRAKFDAAGVHPADLRTLADLSRFPFTTKEDLRSNYPLACSQCRVRRWFAFTLRAAQPVSLR